MVVKKWHKVAKEAHALTKDAVEEELLLNYFYIIIYIINITFLLIMRFPSPTRVPPLPLHATCNSSTTPGTPLTAKP
jgi:hypothetical protein